MVGEERAVEDVDVAIRARGRSIYNRYNFTVCLHSLQAEDFFNDTDVTHNVFSSLLVLLLLYDTYTALACVQIEFFISPILPSPIMNRCAIQACSQLLRRRPVAISRSSAALAAACSLSMPRRFNSATAEGAEAAAKPTENHPPGYHVDPYPQRTYFQIHVLPFIYFIGFWLLLGLTVKNYFFASKKVEAVEAKPAKK